MNEVYDITALGQLTHLRRLGLNNGARHMDMRPLAGLYQLDTLEIFNLELEPTMLALSSLTQLRTLTVESMHEIYRIHPPIWRLDTLTSLTSLCLRGRFYGVSDLRIFSSIINLESLTLELFPWVTSLDGLAECKQLRFLELSNMNFEEAVYGISCPFPQNLQELRLISVPMVDVVPITKLYRLNTLYLHDITALVDIDPLATMSSLCKLTLSSLMYLDDIQSMAMFKARDDTKLILIDMEHIHPDLC